MASARFAVSPEIMPESIRLIVLSAVSICVTDINLMDFYLSPASVVDTTYHGIIVLDQVCTVFYEGLVRRF
jgi:hypothetical protein